MPSAKIPISAYDIMNPHISSDVDISMIDKKGKFQLKKDEEGYRPKYILEIADTTDFDFIYKGKDAETSIQNLLIALNLNLETVVFTRHISNKHYEQIDYTEKDKEEYDDIDTNVRYTLVTKQDLSEKSVIDTFEDLARLNRFDLNNPTIKNMNLIKAIFLYEAAMESSNRFVQHMMLYMTMETACLYDGNYKSGSELDQKMSRISGISKKEISKWRRNYNRQKHVDTDQSDVTQTKDIIEKSRYVRDFRIAANQVLNKRM